MNAPAAPSLLRERVRVEIRGFVQGVGFRPFVYREAHAVGLTGWVANTAAGVTIEAEGPADRIASFLRVIREAPPGNAAVAEFETLTLLPCGGEGFEVRASTIAGEHSASILPDLSTCPECLAELFAPGDRRYRYPFINCTNCGPRYSIIEDLPYDRARTSMRSFPLCDACSAEYEDPRDRRFHAEPNACPVCGPQLALWSTDGRPLDQGDAALLAAAAAIRAGAIVALKGLGGFHLIVDARSEAAVRRLRQRKLREEKPFAVMFPSADAIEAECHVNQAEAEVLASPQRPIVLLRRRGYGLAQAVAPRNPCVGAMLPYTPLHHLLLAELGFPVIATSGNRSDEPIVTDEREALRRLAGIADLFLVHDRPIVRPVDDSVVRIIAGRPVVLRRARGYAPAPVAAGGLPSGILALGGHLKTTVALTLAKGVVLGQHVGDLDTAAARDAYDRARDDVVRLHAMRPRLVVRDLHPDYHSSRVAETTGLPVVAVQHHLAHVVACMADNGLKPPVLGVAWDGTGYGPDATIWGGEFLHITAAGWRRVAHLRPFRLPGGEAAMREPRRSALGLLHAAYGRGFLTMTDLAPIARLSGAERDVFATMLERGINAPLTTSAGRLFDAVASILGLRQQSSYEGQAAMELEWAADDGDGIAFAARAGLPYLLRESRPVACRPGTSSPIGRGLSALASEGAQRPRRLGRKGEGIGPIRRGRNPSPLSPKLAPLAKATSPLPMGEEAPLAQGREHIPAEAQADQRYEFPIVEQSDASLIVDWASALGEIIADFRSATPPSAISARFHHGLAAAIAAVAARVGEERVVLTGGCFQNAFLTEAAIGALSAAGLVPHWHRNVPPNDGGLALGQAIWAASLIERGEVACA